MEEYPHIDFLGDLAEEAGKIILDYFNKAKASWKEDRSPITKADKLINDLVIRWISESFPKISVIAEEGNRIVDNADYTIFCDPLDGTLPFIWGMPLVTCCITVVAGSTMPIVGLIYDPFLDRMWWAEKGHGAFLDDRPIKVSQNRSLADASICVTYREECGYNMHKVCAKVMNKGARWFNIMSIAYPGGLLAMGKIHATIFQGQKSWETAAMQIIVEEAGGKVTDIFGNEMVYSPEGDIRGHIITNGFLHDELVALVKSCQ